MQRVTNSKTLYFRPSGLGDDISVYWALVAATKAGLLSGMSAYFERPETREFLKDLSVSFDDVRILSSCKPEEVDHLVRLGGASFGMPDLVNSFKYNYALSSPYFNRLFVEYGRRLSRPPIAQRLVFLLGVMSQKICIWLPPHDDIYNGWQEISVALGFSKSESLRLQVKIKEQWSGMRQVMENRYQSKPVVGSVAVFPGSNSFQGFDESVVDVLRKTYPQCKVARFNQDKMSADIRYGSLHELCELLLTHETCITADSAASHLAQFFSHKHVLLCTRSRPSNVCFPGAKNTYILDLGTELKCRPCLYYPKKDNLCSAGFPMCQAYENILNVPSSLKSI